MSIVEGELPIVRMFPDTDASPSTTSNETSSPLVDTASKVICIPAEKLTSGRSANIMLWAIFEESFLEFITPIASRSNPALPVQGVGS